MRAHTDDDKNRDRVINIIFRRSLLYQYSSILRTHSFTNNVRSITTVYSTRRISTCIVFLGHNVYNKVLRNLFFSDNFSNKVLRKFFFFIFRKSNGKILLHSYDIYLLMFVRSVLQFIQRLSFLN